MFKIFFFLALISGVISYINMDPMKSSFFLIFSLLFSMPILTTSIHVWFSYFICLLFLSGIFVILVYFSSLSKISPLKGHMKTLLLVFSLFSFSLTYVSSKFLNLTGFYYSIYWSLFIFILVSLLFFMNFSSYFLSFSGALRKV